MAGDPTILIRPRAVNVSNGERFITQRGKKEAQLLLGMSIPAVTPGTYFQNQINRSSKDYYPGQLDFTAWKGSSIVTTLTIYPQDVVGGWDNFQGHGEPEPPFLKQWVTPGVVLLTNYGPYNYAQDLLGHRSIDFQKAPDFNQEQNQYLLTALVPTPNVAGDVIGIRLGALVIETYTAIAANRGAWHVVLMPDIAPPPPTPPTPFPFIPNTATVDVRLKVGYQPWKVHKGDVIG